MTEPTIEPGWTIIRPDEQARFEPKQDDDELWCAACKDWHSVGFNGLFMEGLYYRRRTPATAKEPTQIEIMIPTLAADCDELVVNGVRFVKITKREGEG